MCFNTVSLLFPVIGHHANIWWLDPLGAALLSLYIIYDWAHTCLENVSRLTGAAVDDRLRQKITYMAWRFSPLVEAFKSINACVSSLAGLSVPYSRSGLQLPRW